MRGSVASQSCSARQKCASFRVYYNARVREAHLCYFIGNFVPITEGCHYDDLIIRGENI